MRPVSLVDMTLHELAIKLREEGFVWKKLPRRKAEQATLKYVPGTDRVVYFHECRVPLRFYMIALLRADNMEKEVPHVAGTATYKELLEEGNPSPGRLRLRLESEMPDDLPGPGEHEASPCSFFVCG